MVDMTLWLSREEAMEPETRAALAWKRINDKPTEVVFRTPAGVSLVPQTVRLESDSSYGGVVEIGSTAGTAPKRGLTVFGVAGHPSVADTVIGEGYRFNHNGDQYRIIDVIATLGEVQGVCEAVG